MKKTLGYLKIIAAMLIWGTLGIFVKMTGLPSSEIVLFRIIIAGVFLLIVYFLGHRASHGEAFRKYFFVLLISGICMGLDWLFFFEAYRYISVSLTTVAYYCAPIIVTLFSPIVLREKIVPVKLMGIFTALAGLILIAGSIGLSAGEVRGLSYGLLAALFYAAVTILNKCVKGLSGIEITLIQLLGAFSVMLPYCIITLKDSFVWPSSRTALISMLILGIVHSAIALLLYFSSLQVLSAQTAALCSFIDPGSTLVFSALILHEKLSFVQIIAAILILGGAFLGEALSAKSSRRRKS